MISFITRVGHSPEAVLLNWSVCLVLRSLSHLDLAFVLFGASFVLIMYVWDDLIKKVSTHYFVLSLCVIHPSLSSLFRHSLPYVVWELLRPRKLSAFASRG
jgi:hypothetical protein